MNHLPRRSPSPFLHSAAIAASLALLMACTATRPTNEEAVDSGNLLRNSLPVAAAALAAGQLDVARRLYLSLAERFPDAPEPVLGLGYIAFNAGEFPAAEDFFQRAAKNAPGSPDVLAESRLGSGRAALARGRVGRASKMFERASEAGRDTPAAPWIENGLAVAATLETDYEAAEPHYREALRLSGEDSRITANYVRMLVADERVDEAARLHAGKSASYWVDGDGDTLARLIERFRRKAPAAPRDGSRPTEPGPGSTPAAEGGAAPSAAAPLRPGSGLELELSALRPDTAFRPDTIEPEPPGGAMASSPVELRIVDWPGALIPPVDRVVGDDPADAGTETEASPAAPATLADAPTPPDPPPSAPPPDGGDAGTTDGPSLAAEDRDAPANESTDPMASSTLALVLGQSRRLRIERDAAAVSVASPEIADVQLLAPDVIYVIGKGLGRTSITLLADDGSSLEHIVSVEPDLAPLRKTLRGEADLRGVEVRSLARGVALAGGVASAEAAEHALRIAAAVLPEGVPVENHLRVGGAQQVNLEVQIAEVHRSVTEDLGVSWETFGTKGADRYGFRIGRVLPEVAERTLFGTGSFSPTLLSGEVATSAYFGTTGTRGQLRAMIDALSTAGLANVLARPNVTAVSGESASFFSGGEYPLPTGFEDGVIIFEYKKYGILLDFVPTVVSPGHIVLTVRPEVSEPSLNQSIQIVGVEIPVINVRRAETTVEVGDGESIVIAGLFRSSSNTVESGVPGLKDVPLLGALFGQSSIRSEELELIVTVTARLVYANARSEDDDPAPSPVYRRAAGYHF